MNEDEVLYTRTVQVGEVIKSPHFENLLYRDIIGQDAMLGFYVNPMVTSKTWDNLRCEMLENPGRIKRTSRGVGKSDNYVNLKTSVDHKREFVVIRIQRNTDCIPEVLKENEAIGTYPLQITAKMLDPEGNWDPDGVEIIFHMESELAKHRVPEVITCGFMQITYTRLL